MPAKVLDSFALIAYFRDEPGAETMENLLVTAGKKDNLLHDRCELCRGQIRHYEAGRHGCLGLAAKILQGLPIDFHSTNARGSTRPPASPL